MRRTEAIEAGIRNLRETITALGDTIRDPFGIRRLQDRIEDLEWMKKGRWHITPLEKRLAAARRRRNKILIGTGVALSAAAVAGAIGMHWMSDHKDQGLSGKDH